jgi:hypothetical protein
MRICLKELRETRRWLRLSLIVPLAQNPSEVQRLTKETQELIKIFAASVRTALRNKQSSEARATASTAGRCAAGNAPSIER